MIQVKDNFLTQYYRVAIVGRPNVGKSTLFNRFLKRRVAISDPIPGATRDLVTRLCVLNNKKFNLVDTGGCRPDVSGDLERMAVELSLEESERADLILLIVEAGSRTTEDDLMIQRLRKRADSVLLVVNKCDSIEKEWAAQEYASVGFKNMFLVSAEHNRNLGALEEALANRIPGDPIEEESDDVAVEINDYIKLAIVGKPNAGKSSLANTLIGEERSMVSEIAGTTRDAIISRFEFNGTKFEIVDTAGIRRRTKVAERLEFYSVKRAERAVRECDVVALMLDVQEGLTGQDKKIADIIVEAHKPLLFVINKWDLKEKETVGVKRRSSKNDILKEEIELLRYNFPVLAYAPVVTVSAKEGKGIDALLKAIIRLNVESGRRINDGELNTALKEWTRDTPPPRDSRARVISLCQVGTAPARFRLKSHGAVPDSYMRFLTNKVREEFGFKTTPILMEASHG